MDELKIKVKEAIEYWEGRLHSYCESGSPRDHLAINDLDNMIKYIKKLEAQPDNRVEWDEGEVQKVISKYRGKYITDKNLAKSLTAKFKPQGVRLAEAEIRKIITRACSKHFDLHDDISCKKITRSKGLDLMIKNVDDSYKAIDDCAKLNEGVRLPELKARILTKDRLEYQQGICEGRCQMRSECEEMLKEQGVEVCAKLNS